MSRSNVWRVAVDTRGSALPSAAKANNYPQVWNKDEKSREELLSVRGLCVSTNRADAVDRLLIETYNMFNCDKVKNNEVP